MANTSACRSNRGSNRHARAVHAHTTIAVKPVLGILDIESEARAVTGQVEQTLVGRDNEFRWERRKRLTGGRRGGHQKVVRERG